MAVLHDSKRAIPTRSGLVQSVACTTVHCGPGGDGGIYAWTILSVAIVGRRMGRDWHSTWKHILGIFTGVLSSA